MTGAAGASFSGLPFVRTYSLEDMGQVSRGVTLSFDSLGRLAVVQEGSYLVLNDTTWVNLIDPGARLETLQQVVHTKEEGVLYGGGGAWGRMELDATGKFVPKPFKAVDVPAWVSSTNFTHILPCGTGVLFGGWNGIAYWERATGSHLFFRVEDLRWLFHLKGRYFVGARYRGLQEFLVGPNPRLGSVELGADAGKLDRFCELRDGRILFSTTDKRLLVFDGDRLTPIMGGGWGKVEDRVLSMQGLPEGGVAIATMSKGLVLLAPDGSLTSWYDSPEYRGVKSLAANEAGVLWMANETGVASVHYGCVATVFDRRLGLPIEWPQVVKWKGRCVVSTSGRLYETSEDRESQPATFHLISGQPTHGAWAIAAHGDQLLVGNDRGVYARRADGRFMSVLPGVAAARLAFLDDTHCLAISQDTLSLLSLVDARWTLTEQTGGLGYPNVIHSSGRAVWIELGVNRVARVSLKDGRLVVREIDSFPPESPQWINVSVLGDVVVLSGAFDQRQYFDEKLEQFVGQPPMLKFLDEGPYRISRVARDLAGNMWCSHSQGVFRLMNTADGLKADHDSLARIRDHFPLIQVMDESNVWLSTGSAMYNVDASAGAQCLEWKRPALVSVVDAESGNRYEASRSNGALHHLLPGHNSVHCLFFSGGYARTNPGYEFRLNSEEATWSVLAQGSQLTLPNLPDGRSVLEVRPMGVVPSKEAILTLYFHVPPPWHRTVYAKIGYTVFLAGLVFLLVRWLGYRSRLRNLKLEALVRKRTDDLQEALKRIEADTRKNAIQAERNRIAGEIHDSIQQGLSGLMLQVDATILLENQSPEVLSRLGVARNMISYTRQELQSAIWDMESPLLENADLKDAILRMCAQLDTGAARLETHFEGEAISLPAATKHHLLRMAQEALTNALRYSRATEIRISLKYSSERVSLCVEDNGCGFDVSKTMGGEAGHFGLRGMAHRADKINAELRIQSRPGAGTTIQIELSKEKIPTD